MKIWAGIVLLQDNTRAHMAGLTQSMLTTLKFEVFTHPAYSSDLSTSDYEVFDLLKKFFEGKCFFTDKEVKKMVKEWMLQVGVEFWKGELYKLQEC